MLFSMFFATRRSLLLFPRVLFRPKCGKLSPTEKPRPFVPGYKSVKFDSLKAGEKLYWCTCGLSLKQPWCDGSHKPTQFEPLLWTVPEPSALKSSRISICLCKYSSNPPFCDGTHHKLKQKLEVDLKPCDCGEDAWGPNSCDSTKVRLFDGRRIYCTVCGQLRGGVEQNAT